MSKASEARWLAAYKAADTLYTAKECGCLVLVMVDLPDVIKSSRDDILRESLEGRALQRVGRGLLPPLNCPAHESERRLDRYRNTGEWDEAWGPAPESVAS